MPLLLLGCSPTPKTSKTSEAPAADNAATRYSTELHYDTERARQAADKMNESIQHHQEGMAETK
jgi:hypothetical protein